MLIRPLHFSLKHAADVIVGFPGETEEQFENTLELMRKVKYDNLNTFAYSPRPNTEAALWPDQVRAF